MEIVPSIDLEAENKEIIRRYRKLLRYAKPSLKEGDTKIIRRAFNMSMEAHKNMRRKSGEPYIYHPLEVAQICIEEIGLGTTAIVSALLHDVVEDSEIELEDIDRNFGPNVARIIDGLTKISGVFEYGTSQQAENFRKMVLTLSDDVRVILVKLADRLHNMRTLESMPRHKQLKIASETIYMYAPLAHRLGLYAIKSELEDLYLKYTDPEAYTTISQKISDTQSSRNKFIRDFISPIQDELRKHTLEFKIKGRPKSVYSVWNKMKKQNISFEEIYDLFAIRIIVKCPIEQEKSLCWQIYSIVTDYYKPSPDRLRDWISTPKANGYESLHTTVMSSMGRWVEVQIRTERMDEIAEKGYAAHWKYKSKNDGSSESSLDSWINKIRNLIKHSDSSALDFVDEFKSDLFSEEIFVFTPKGDLKILPHDARVLDFAFDIHTQVGLHCIGAKVNHKLVPVSHVLKNGDQVEVITSSKQWPTEDTLRLVETSKAKKKIRDFLNEQKRKEIEDGRAILEKFAKDHKKDVNKLDVKFVLQYFRIDSIATFYYKIGNGTIKESDLKVILDGKLKKDAVESLSEDNPNAVSKMLPNNTLIIGEEVEGVTYNLAKCCNPIPGDEVFGFVTVDEGIKIHRANCQFATSLMSNYGYRIIKAQWSHIKENNFSVGLKIAGLDRVGLLYDITKIIAIELKVNIVSMVAQTNDGIVEDHLTLLVRDKKHLEELLISLRKLSGILSVERIETT